MIDPRIYDVLAHMQKPQAGPVSALRQPQQQQGGFRGLMSRPGVGGALQAMGAAMMAQSDSPGQSFLGNLGRSFQPAMQAYGGGQQKAALSDALKGAPDSMRKLLEMNPQLFMALQAHQATLTPDVDRELRPLADGTIGVFENGVLERTEGPTNAIEDETPTQTDEIRKEFNALPVVDVWRQVNPAYQSALASRETDTSAGDLDIIYAVAKSVDPNSVVREGEAMMVTDAASPAQRFLGMFNYVQGGGRLTAEQRNQLMGLVENRMEGHRSNYNQALELYTNIAEHRALDPNLIFMGGNDPVRSPNPYRGR